MSEQLSETASPIENISIVRGVPPNQQQRTAEIYYIAFAQKLALILGGSESRTIQILQKTMVPQQAFVAIQDGQVVGLMGFQHDGKQLFDIRFSTLLREFGVFKGLWRALWGALLERTPQKNVLFIDGVAVHPDARGLGIGTRLFGAITAFAREEGYYTVRLDVVDTNPRAKQLYKRLGFVEVKTQSVPFMKRMGFTAVTSMQLELTPNRGKNS